MESRLEEYNIENEEIIRKQTTGLRMEMGLEQVPSTSTSYQEEKIHPYLVKLCTLSCPAPVDDDMLLALRTTVEAVR